LVTKTEAKPSTARVLPASLRRNACHIHTHKEEDDRTRSTVSLLYEQPQRAGFVPSWCSVTKTEAKPSTARVLPAFLGRNACHTHILTHAPTHTATHAHTHTLTSTLTPTLTHTLTPTPTPTRSHTQTHPHTHPHTRPHTRPHTHTHKEEENYIYPNSLINFFFFLVDRQYQKTAYKDSEKRMESFNTFIKILAIYSLE
jgi:hypothetical protein